MRQLYLEGKKRKKLSSDKWMDLEYYMTEDTIKTSSEMVIYGISIFKKVGHGIEIEETGGVSESMEIVKDMIHTLMNAAITPLVMLEVVDDLITERICS